MDACAKRAIVDARPGDPPGAPGRVTVTQAMIDDFSLATLDHAPMHADPEWAAEHMLHDTLGDGPATAPERTGCFLNLGFNRMRLATPVEPGPALAGAWLSTRSRRQG